MIFLNGDKNMENSLENVVENVVEKYLFDKWCNLLLLLGIESVKTTEKTFARLVEAYSHPSRHYHTLEHIFHVINTIQTLQNLTNQLTSVEFAAWFHDIVYDPKAQDNEEKSAVYAADLMQSLEIDARVITNVTRLILNTKFHQADTDDIESQILLDADIAILGSPKQKYLTYAEDIRQEYSWIPDQDYRLGRRQVLEKFLQRKRIYYTDLMFEELEESARINLAAEIQSL